MFLKTQHLLKALMVMLLLSLGQTTWAQQRTATSTVTGQTTGAQQLAATGTVTDQTTGSPIAGVSVSIKGSTGGTRTDANGKFTINASANATLFISYVGYESKEVKASTQPLSIQLLSQEVQLENVVVVGTRMRKSDLTGAVGNISSKQLQEVPTSDLTTAMQGKVAGLNITRTNATPGEDISIKVRGNNSISYGTSPVYVIDGIVSEEGLRMISPDDIASIEVLKDASSTALYGSKASNGVIVITTKRGQGKGKISYSGFVTISNYQDRLKRLNSKDMIDLRFDGYANAYMDENPTADRAAYLESLLSRTTGNNVVLSPEELENYKANKTNNWLNELTRTGVEQNHSLNFSGSDETSNYFVGFNYSNNQGVLTKSSYQRLGARVNYQKTLRDWLKIGTNTNITRGAKNRLDGNAYETALMANPLQNIDTDRLYLEYQGVVDNGRYNPILTTNIDGTEIHNRVLTTNFVEITPLQNLNFRSTISADIYNKQDNRYVPSYVGQSVREGNNGEGWQWRGLNEYWQWDNSISYEKTFGKHRLFGLLSSTLSKTSGNNLSLSGYNFPTDVLGYHNMGLASNRLKNSFGSDYFANTLSSVIGRVNYSYADKYLLTATVRRDGSSKFAKGHQWGTFPSFSAAWNVNKEDFMSEVTWVDNLKVRAGFGLLGNQNIPNYAYTTIYQANYSNGAVGFSPEDSRLGTPNLTWEKQKQYNLGLDASILNNRVSFSIDAFYMDNSDLLMRRSLWPSFGYNYQIANVARLENKGLEFSFNAKVIDGNDFKWNISGNIAHDRNKVKSLMDGLDVIWNGGITSREGNLFVGQSLNNLYSFKFDKIAQQADMDRIGQMTFYNGRTVRPGDILPKDLNGDGKITAEDDMMIVGKKDPKFYGGFTTNFQYKSFELNATFTYSYGAKRFDGIYERLMDGTATISPAHKDQMNRWTPENTNTKVPRAYRSNLYQRFDYGSTDLGLLDASYLRLASMTLRYNVPSNKINSFLNNLSVYTSANNLFIITPYKGYDPESGQGYPLTRSFTFGLNLSF
ncbi:SusC/RagA family TonB-linked outer membrane protein [Sphingobacterium sp. Mn56C]|uniref:SusC/RagA family TonB-linked outer membrane protein n=1 Tax=Sphingobacterium sp. Mn56C TaxID=3395261 RepID=UPI003BBB9AB1